MNATTTTYDREIDCRKSEAKSLMLVLAFFVTGVMTSSLILG